ncbi:putative alginate lyase AlyVOB [Nautilia profundicola AmH]|uniref:Alginate lyase AlyVOB n=1 Tax=Nautilia profundicola (strain ATCC BAA-1463 / DSM 18972 / AmH) TaxID=598659 RepID=B9LAA8_NAUPA|nr:polysaccharide lyase family 7 protein [Nautilia profundicola]ACM92753.1 putative alginate lyase AlyVOB [Nautilia profundicola AmH]
MKIFVFFIFITFYITLNAKENNSLEQLLENSVKLQAPTSKYNPLYSVKYGEFKYNIKNKYFQIKDKKAVFNICGYKKRSELRFRREWKVENKSGVFLEVKVRIFPLDCDEFTFLQIHADPRKCNAPNKPLLRITFIRKFKNRENYIFAIIYKKNGYEKIALGKYTALMNIRIEVKNNRLKIIFNGKNIQSDVAYWKGYYNYFKLGVYNQCKGCSEAVFYDIRTNTIFYQDINH